MRTYRIGKLADCRYFFKKSLPRCLKKRTITVGEPHAAKSEAFAALFAEAGVGLQIIDDVKNIGAGNAGKKRGAVFPSALYAKPKSCFCLWNTACIIPINFVRPAAGF